MPRNKIPQLAEEAKAALAHERAKYGSDISRSIDAFRKKTLSSF